MTKAKIINTVEKELPEFTKSCKIRKVDTVMFHQTGFGNSEEEMLLMAMVIKYAGFNRKNIQIICQKK